MSALFENTHFLIAEDDEVDILALKRILIEIDKEISFSIAHDGIEALKVLRENSDKPAEEQEQMIVLLDLNMPRMGGHEFLQALREEANIKDTVVFVLSTSTDPRDIGDSYSKHVSGYIPKEKLNAETFKRLFESYLELNQFPKSH
ncbi:MAG: hypothetical protein CMK09_13170 [Ponticaulis sp.]|nr:hypothetical protein [Ponticaulis sp.]|tara:strand:+ start:9042 stop:9479 length:438 start_codon:yes stop_codon:yes gene_type:complete